MQMKLGHILAGKAAGFGKDRDECMIQGNSITWIN